MNDMGVAQAFTTLDTGTVVRIAVRCMVALFALREWYTVNGRWIACCATTMMGSTSENRGVYLSEPGAAGVHHPTLGRANHRQASSVSASNNFHRPSSSCGHASGRACTKISSGMVYSIYSTYHCPSFIYRAFHCPGLRDITQDKLTTCEEGAGVLHNRNVSWWSQWYHCNGNANQ